MEFLDNLIKTSLLGTERQSIDKSLLPDSLLTYIEKIEEKGLDKEDHFLQSSALLFNYYNSGKIPNKIAIRLPPPADEEVMPYCSDKAAKSLQSALEEGLSELLEYWLDRCVHFRQIAKPEWIPLLLEEGKKNNKIRSLIKEAVGKRGSWLAQFNQDWKYLNSTQQEIWETGKPDERKQLFIQLRKTEPEKARVLLSSSWKEENANTRSELLSILSINMTIEDEEFLNEALKDPSAKVKAIAIDLLGGLADSKWTKELWEMGKSWLDLKVSKSILQFTKEEIEISIPSTFPAELKKRGFQELSSNKEISDKEYWLFQLLSNLPPSYLEKNLNSSPDKILTLFSKNKSLQKIIHALVYSTIRYKDQKWAKALLEEKLNRNEYLKISSLEDLNNLLELVSTEDKKYFYDKNLDKKDFPFKLTLIDFLNALGFDWDLPFTIKALKDLTGESQEGFIYGYTKLLTLAQYAHPEVMDHLKEIEPKDDTLRDKWNTLFGRFFKVLEIKRGIDEGFKS